MTAPPIDLQQTQLLEIISTQTDIAKLGADLGGVMSLVAERSQNLTEADGAVIELAEGEDMVYRATSGIAENLLGLRLRRSGSLSGLCVAEGQPLNCEDSEEDPRVDRQACRRVGLRSMIVTPLKHGDSVIGVLKVLSKHFAFFSKRDLHTLDLLSGLVAAAMYHAAQAETNELLRRATHDPLTGLANRALFYDRLRNQLQSAKRSVEKVAVVNLDMDGLKPINDQFGHRAGDAALQAVAERVKAETRATDTVARMGGDEFALLMPLKSNEELPVITERLNRSISAPFSFEKRELQLGASIGTAVFPDNGTEPDQLIEYADQAMYQVKRNRRA